MDVYIYVIIFCVVYLMLILFLINWISKKTGINIFIILIISLLIPGSLLIFIFLALVYHKDSENRIQHTNEFGNVVYES